MAGRVLLGGILGSIVAFAWGFMSWMVLPWHTATIHRLTDEPELAQSLPSHADRHGVYAFPYWPDDPGDQAAMDEFLRRHKAGPVGMLIVSPTGRDPMSARTYIQSGAINLAGALLLALLMSQAAGTLRNYLGRVGFAAVMGLFAGLVIWLPLWNWFDFPADFVAVNLADVTATWLAAGLVIAAVVRPRPTALPEVESDETLD